MHSVGTVKALAGGAMASNFVKRLSSSNPLFLSMRPTGVLGSPSITNSVLDLSSL